jgi:hypothetical protein
MPGNNNGKEKKGQFPAPEGTSLGGFQSMYLYWNDSLSFWFAPGLSVPD